MLPQTSRLRLPPPSSPHTNHNKKKHDYATESAGLVPNSFGYPLDTTRCNPGFSWFLYREPLFSLLFRSTFRRQSRRAGPPAFQSLPPDTTRSLSNLSSLCLLFRLECFPAQTRHFALHPLALREGSVSLRDPSSDPHHISPSVTISARYTPTFQVPPLDSQWRLVSINARSLVHCICVASNLRAEGNCIWCAYSPSPSTRDRNTTP